MMQNLPSLVEMERAHIKRDASYDGIFFLAVRTTGVFCRPSCPARKPLPSNIEYFPSAREAVFAGYRPCKRCLGREITFCCLSKSEGAILRYVSSFDRHRAFTRTALLSEELWYDVPGLLPRSETREIVRTDQAGRGSR